MKKLIITSVILLGTAGAIFAQSTTSSTDKAKSTKASGQGVQTPNPKNEKQQADAAKDQQAGQPQNTTSARPNPTDQVAQKSSEGDGSNRPGGATHENANDVGRYSDDNADEKSMLFSKEAISIRRRNMTEPDKEVKSGSGSSERNTKNHTGTTGNYRNLATQTSRIPSSE